MIKKNIMLILLLVMIPISCGDNQKKNSRASNKETAGSEVVSSKKESANPVVKGFQVGMSVEDAVDKAKEISSNVFIIIEKRYQDWDFRFHFNVVDGKIYKFDLENDVLVKKLSDETSNLKYSPYKSVEFTCLSHHPVAGNKLRFPVEKDLQKIDYEISVLNPDNKNLITFSIKENRVDKIIFTCLVFNACDIDVGRFAKEFLDSYKIPELKPYYSSEWDSGWRYESDNGWKVRIGKAYNSVTIEKTTAKSELKFD